MAKPVDIAHAPKHNTLTVTWDDGIVSTYPVPYLRGWCPCAGCQGHGNAVVYREASEEIGAAGIYEIGAYAITIRFSDGHDAGIYSWQWLRAIAPETPPTGLKRGRFDGGLYEASGPEGPADLA